MKRQTVTYLPIQIISLYFYLQRAVLELSAAAATLNIAGAAPFKGISGACVM